MEVSFKRSRSEERYLSRGFYEIYQIDENILKNCPCRRKDKKCSNGLDCSNGLEIPQYCIFNRDFKDYRIKLVIN
jgi:hypothetical protein